MYVNGPAELFKVCNSCAQEMLVSHLKNDQSSVQFKSNQMFCAFFICVQPDQWFNFIMNMYF